MKQVKIFLAGCMSVFLASSVMAGPGLIIAADDEVETPCEVRSYDGKKKTVKLKYGSSLTNQLLSAFSTTNQTEILEWVADENFDSSKLRVRIRKKSRDRETRRGEVEDVTYTVELENRGSIALENVTVECQIFYDTQDVKTEGKRKSVKISSVNILPSETQKVRSEMIQIRDEKIITPGYDTRVNINTGYSSFTTGSMGGGAPTKYYKDRLRGAHVLVSRVNRNGEIVERKFKEGSPPKKDKQSEYSQAGSRRTVPHSKAKK